MSYRLIISVLLFLPMFMYSSMDGNVKCLKNHNKQLPSTQKSLTEQQDRPTSDSQNARVSGLRGCQQQSREDLEEIG